MKAVQFIGGAATVCEVPMPRPRPEELLVKVRASAICGSERKPYLEGRRQGGAEIPGHEMSGEVEDPGASRRFKKGDRVAMQAVEGCGFCLFCRRGNYQFCSTRHHREGAHAAYICLPEPCCISVPGDIPFETAVLLGGDTLGVAFRAARQLEVTARQPVLVFGAGPIGLGIITLLKFLGAYVIVSEPSAYRRSWAREKAGADITLDPQTQEIAVEMKEIAADGPEIVVECSGNPKAQISALQLVRCQGTVLFAGENYAGLEIVPSDHIIHKEVRLLGAFYYSESDFAGVLDLFRRGLDPHRLISHRVSIDEAPRVFREFMDGQTGKVVLDPWV